MGGWACSQWHPQVPGHGQAGTRTSGRICPKNKSLFPSLGPRKATSCSVRLNCGGDSEDGHPPPLFPPALWKPTPWFPRVGKLFLGSPAQVSPVFGVPSCGHQADIHLSDARSHPCAGLWVSPMPAAGGRAAPRCLGPRLSALCPPVLFPAARVRRSAPLGPVRPLQTRLTRGRSLPSRAAISC